MQMPYVLVVIPEPSIAINPYSSSGMKALVNETITSAELSALTESPRVSADCSA
jgi:hypothetical protein